MNSGIDIISLSRHRAGIRRFLKVSDSIYRGDPYWVAPLHSDMQEVLGDGNPFFEHAEMQLWVARRDGRDVGRIAGIIDRQFHKHHDPETACFGFFECEQDKEVSRLLFQTVFDWVGQRGLKRLIGPMDPSMNDQAGLLVKGFELPPVIMMPYHPPYYEQLLLAAGLVKAKDLFAFHIELKEIPYDRLAKIQERFERRRGDLRIRPLRRRTFWQDLKSIRTVYNGAWQKNWGFVPLTEKEVDFLARRLKPLLVDGLVWIAETPEEPVGFLLAVPDYNEAIQPLRGRLLSPGLLKSLPYLLGMKRPRQARVIVLGVRDSYRSRGVESAMLAAGLETGARLGFKGAEASWVLEDNLRSRRVIEAFGGKPYKTYRLYERNVS